MTPTFRTRLLLSGRTATGISAPPAVAEALGAGERPPVRATLHTPGGPSTDRCTDAPRGSRHAKRPDTRAGRVAQATVILHEGRRR